jgi:hypothetical protein
MSKVQLALLDAEAPDLKSEHKVSVSGRVIRLGKSPRASDIVESRESLITFFYIRQPSLWPAATSGPGRFNIPNTAKCAEMTSRDIVMAVVG